MISRTLDWIGFELLSKLCLGHVMWGLALGLLGGALAEDRRVPLVVALICTFGGMAGMVGHYIYRRRAGEEA